MASVTIKHTNSSVKDTTTLNWGELGIANNTLYYGNSSNKPVALAFDRDLGTLKDTVKAQEFHSTKYQAELPITVTYEHIKGGSGVTGTYIYRYVPYSNTNIIIIHGNVSWGADVRDAAIKIKVEVPHVSTEQCLYFHATPYSNKQYGNSGHFVGVNVWPALNEWTVGIYGNTTNDVAYGIYYTAILSEVVI